MSHNYLFKQNWDLNYGLLKWMNDLLIVDIHFLDVVYAEL